MMNKTMRYWRRLNIKYGKQNNGTGEEGGVAKFVKKMIQGE